MVSPSSEKQTFPCPPHGNWLNSRGVNVDSKISYVPFFTMPTTFVIEEERVEKLSICVQLMKSFSFAFSLWKAFHMCSAIHLHFHPRPALLENGPHIPVSKQCIGQILHLIFEVRLLVFQISTQHSKIALIFQASPNMHMCYISSAYGKDAKMPTLGPPLRSTPLLAPLNIGLDIFLALPTFEWEVSAQHSKITLLLQTSYNIFYSSRLHST